MKNKIEGIEHLDLSDLLEFYQANDMSYRDALPVMRELRDKHSLNDSEALRAFGLSKRIFD